MKNELRARIAIGLLIIFGAYVCWIAGSTFLVDDWGQVFLHKVTIFEQLEGWKQLWGFRPVSLILLTLAIHVFSANWFAFAIVNSCLYLFSIWVYLWNKNPIQDLRVKVFSVLLGATPAIASTVIFSPVNQLSATISITFAAIGYLFLEVRSANSKRKTLFKFLATFMFSASLLSYEISLPLILWSCLSNISRREMDAPKESRWKVLLEITPFLIPIFVSIIWQKFVAPQILGSNLSRLTTFSVQSISSLVDSLAFKFPRALLEEAHQNLIGIIVLTVCIIFVAGKKSQNLVGAKIYRIPRTKLFTGLAFFSGFALYAFSGQMSDVVTYINRGMTSIWITGILFGMSLLSSQIKKHELVAIIMSFVIAANALWFFDKVDASNAASRYRLNVLNSISEDIKQIQLEGPTNKTILLLDVPCYLPGNQLGIELFCAGWDANGALIEKGFNFAGVYSLGDPGFHFYKENLLKTGVNNFVILKLRFTREGKLEQINEVNPLAWN